MIRIAIAEDEYFERASLEYFIRERFPQTQVIWTAENGQEALEAAMQAPPDVLIVDINMPVMDGLELCRRLQALEKPCVLVINTAFNLFEYAKKAMQYGVSDYIVKPSPMDEVACVLEKCIEKAEAEAVARASREQMNAQVEAASRRTEDYAFKLLLGERADAMEVLGWHPDRLAARVVRVAGPDAEIMMEIARLLRSVLEDTVWVLINADAAQTLLVLQPKESLPREGWNALFFGAILLLGQHLPEDARIFISAPCTTEKALIDACQAQADRRNVEPGLMSLARRARLLCGVGRSTYERTCSRVQRYLRDSQPEQAVALLTTPLGDVPWDNVMLAMEAAIAVFLQVDLQPMLHAAFMWMRGEECTWLAAVDETCRKVSHASEETTMERALRIIQANFAGDITLTSMAEALGIAPPTFSRLFKQYTGRTFVDLLTDIRIRCALDILDENPQCSLDVLAEKCGISSRSYFCTVFKRVMGMTVTQYVQERQL